jgi:hypothetical protein
MRPFGGRPMRFHASVDAKASRSTSTLRAFGGPRVSYASGELGRVLAGRPRRVRPPETSILRCPAQAELASQMGPMGVACSWAPLSNASLRFMG